jgi:hypothetical protein
MDDEAKRKAFIISDKNIILVQADVITDIRVEMA